MNFLREQNRKMLSRRRCKHRAFLTLVAAHFEFASAAGAVYDRALFFSSITSSGCYEKSCAVIDRAYSGRKFKVSHYQQSMRLVIS